MATEYRNRKRDLLRMWPGSILIGGQICLRWDYAEQEREERLAKDVAT